MEQDSLTIFIVLIFLMSLGTNFQHKVLFLHQEIHMYRLCLRTQCLFLEGLLELTKIMNPIFMNIISYKKGGIK